MEREAQQLQFQIQGEVDKAMEDVTATKLRELQRLVYGGMARCNESKTDSSDKVAECMNKYHHLLQTGSQIIQNEINGFQNRLQRCSMACQDDISDRFPNQGKDQYENERAFKALLQCSKACAATHVTKSLPTITGKIKTELDKVIAAAKL